MSKLSLSIQWSTGVKQAHLLFLESMLLLPSEGISSINDIGRIPHKIYFTYCFVPIHFIKERFSYLRTIINDEHLQIVLLIE